ncbi:MAG: alpha/beta hydrolase [Bifidobacteriaceae bacterium]|jgi:acetyl esterase|nr:alpha/beta hydrolase [Bifidobacteriaceae bacterium]
MRHSPPVHLDIAPSPREAAAEKSARKAISLVSRLPGPLFELVVRLSLAKARRGRAGSGRDPDAGGESPGSAPCPMTRAEFRFDAGHGEYPVRCRWRRDLSPGRHPLFYFVHGGGFIGGDSLTNLNLLERLAADLDVVCAAVDYHLAPELRFPGALDECVAGVLGLVAQAATGRLIDPDRIVLAGDSAGGNLAAGAAVLLKRRHGITPRAQALLYPVTEMARLDTPSHRSKAPENRAMFRFIKVCRKLYARDPADYRDPLFSPLATTAADDPDPTPTLLLLAGRDALLDEGLAYARHQRELGAWVRTVVYDNAHHAFVNNLGDSAVADHAAAEIARLIADPPDRRPAPAADGRRPPGP